MSPGAFLTAVCIQDCFFPPSKMNCLNSVCCCLRDQSSEEERRSILQPPESARISHSSPNDSQCRRSGRITARRVGRQDLDQRFNDFAETFNKQQENYERMQETLKSLMCRYRCAAGSGLSKCLQKIKDMHDEHRITVQMKGYDFGLVVTPSDPMPDSLELTQENIKELCRAAKAIAAIGPKLEEMVDWLLKTEESLAQSVNEAAKTHQESRRLEGNLAENLREASRAKELSRLYREEAQKLFEEVAQLSGVQP